MKKLLIISLITIILGLQGCAKYVTTDWCRGAITQMVRNRENFKEKLRKAQPGISEEALEEFVKDSEKRYKVSCYIAEQNGLKIKQFRKNLKYLYENGSPAFGGKEDDEDDW